MGDGLRISICVFFGVLLAPLALPAQTQDGKLALPADPVRQDIGAQTCTDCTTIPALTPIRVEILATLGSKISKTGEIFPIRLAEPIRIGDRDLVPAGLTGEGEVIHAKKSGGSGAAGELVLAARFLDMNGRHLPLRSMKIAVAGKSHVGSVGTLAVASAASPVPFGLIGFFVQGGQVTIAQGTIADAKTAETFTFGRASNAP